MKRSFGVCALIGICFLLTGSEYISWWLYKLPTVFESTSVDILSEGAGYILQAAGLALAAAAAKKSPKKFLSGAAFCGFIVFDVLMSFLAFVCAEAFGILFFGLLMNLAHGVVAAYYLFCLSGYVEKKRKGTVFALAYAFGSVGSWLLSLLNEGGFLGRINVFYLYAFLALSAVGINVFLASAEDGPLVKDSPDKLSFKNPVWPTAAAAIVLLSLVKGLGFYFPSENHLNGELSAVAMRAFYALGLIAAGIQNDKSRKWGSVCCLAALLFPFLSLALENDSSAGTILWIAGYIFFGFFSVYRVVTFADISAQKAEFLPLAAFGLLFGRLGDALGVLGGIFLSKNSSVLLAAASVLFVAAVFSFFRYYNLAYASVPAEGQETKTPQHAFESRFAFSAREAEVFRLIICGCSNSEIASRLFIAESTVKFHVKNILHKTSCANRTELLAEYNRPVGDE